MQKILTTSNSPDSSDSPATNKSLLYGTCVVLSVIISWGIFSQFLFSDGASLSSFFQQAFATPVATLISSDIVLSALIFWAFAHIELKRLGMPANRLLLYVLVTCSVGICGGLSLFLYQRERWVNSAAYKA